MGVYCSAFISITLVNPGKTIEVVTKQGELFDAYVSIDPQTNDLLALRADRVSVPKEIKGNAL